MCPKAGLLVERPESDKGHPHSIRSMEATLCGTNTSTRCASIGALHHFWTASQRNRMLAVTYGGKGQPTRCGCTQRVVDRPTPVAEPTIQPSPAGCGEVEGGQGTCHTGYARLKALGVAQEGFGSQAGIRPVPTGTKLFELSGKPCKGTLWPTRVMFLCGHDPPCPSLGFESGNIKRELRKKRFSLKPIVIPPPSPRT